MSDHIKLALMTGGVGVGASTDVGGARVGVGVGTSTVIHDPNATNKRDNPSKPQPDR